MSRPQHASLLWSAILLATGALYGCKDDPPGKVVEEDGVWSLLRYDSGEGVMQLDQDSQKDAFLLKFESGPNVVTAAACGMETTDNEPGTSVCKQHPTITGWACRCFGYAYEEDRMQWREFMAGDPPPNFAFDESMADGGGDEGTSAAGSGGGGGGDSYITIAQIPNSDKYNFQPLPEGVFGSDGQASRYEMVKRATSQFDNFVYTDEQFACTPCVPD
jgi:hypothetical protein